MSYASFVKRVVRTGDARPCLAAKGFFRQPYAIFHFSMQGNEKAASCEAAVFSYLLLPKHEALVVGVWAIALIERILPVPRRDARKVDEACLAATLLDHLVDIVSDVRLI